MEIVRKDYTVDLESDNSIESGLGKLSISYQNKQKFTLSKTYPTLKSIVKGELPNSRHEYIYHKIESVIHNISYFLLNEQGPYVSNPSFRRVHYVPITLEELEYLTAKRPDKNKKLSLAEEVQIFTAFNYHKKLFSDEEKKILKSNKETGHHNNVKEMFREYDITIKFHNSLTLANTPLVRKMINDLKPPLEYDEALYFGTMGLSNAIKKFDCSKGYKLSTYAYNGIAQYIKRAANLKTTRQKRQENYLIYAQHLDQHFTPTPSDDDLILNAIKGILWNNSNLTKREKVVLEKRFLVNNSKPETLEQIGNFFNVTKETIRKSEAIAISKLKKELTKKFPSLFH